MDKKPRGKLSVLHGEMWELHQAGLGPKRIVIYMGKRGFSCHYKSVENYIKKWSNEHGIFQTVAELGIEKIQERLPEKIALMGGAARPEGKGKQGLPAVGQTVLATPAAPHAAIPLRAPVARARPRVRSASKDEQPRFEWEEWATWVSCGFGLSLEEEGVEAMHWMKMRDKVAKCADWLGSMGETGLIGDPGDLKLGGNWKRSFWREKGVGEMNRAELMWLIELREKLYPERKRLAGDSKKYWALVNQLQGLRGLYGGGKVGLDEMSEVMQAELRHDRLVIYFTKLEGRFLPRASYLGLSFERNLSNLGIG
jgi:hypothetical protein